MCVKLRTVAENENKKGQTATTKNLTPKEWEQGIEL